MKKFVKGFTLAELIVVVAILAILATVGFLALSGYSQDAKDSALKANVRSVQTAISSESAITNNSPRYYVVHDTGASLSGAFVYFEANPVALTGGNWNVAGTNYSAGNPDYAKLKLNPEKFKTAWIESALAAYDPKYLSIGAVDAAVTGGGKSRVASYFQVAGISPTTGTVTISGNYPASSGSVAGLIKDPTSPSATGALVDSGKSGLPPSCPNGQTWNAGTSSCVSNSIVATGGTVSTATIGGITYKVHKFTSGTSTFSVTSAPSGAKIEYLAIGGGGGGGYSGNGGGGGGGGAGGLLSSTGFAVSTGNSFAVSIGAGGGAGSNGGDTVFGSLTAYGGGGGGVGGNASGKAGGSGGGGNPVGGSYGAGTNGQGFRGGYVGSLSQGDNGAAGGGGAGGAGTDNTWSNAGTPGGPGLSFDISGTSVTYAAGGYGGGGTYWYTGAAGANGGANTGNGGGGAGPGGSAGVGGSGIVIVRYVVQ